ncbi:MAG: carbohydrate kinase family protein [Candidatus Kerfeldbacteria bacterium]|nr:carbohydrate kinase family protein [Candidatus Kerfeldbacteria bacterium]
MTKRFDIITIGAATRDVFLRSAGIKIIRNENFSTGEAECFALGSKIEVQELVFETGGGATNTAVGFSRQGFRTAFIGKIGHQDARGQEVLRALRMEKVNVGLVTKDHQRGTAYSVLLLTSRGERTALVYRGASADFHPRDLPRREFRADWMYVSSLAGELPIIRRIWNVAKKKKIRIAWNPGSSELAHGLSKLEPFLQQADVVIMNQEEAARLMKLTTSQDDAPFQYLRRITGGVTVVTMGTEGSFGGDRRSAWHCGTHHVHVVDTTGAGDAFGSGFVSAFIRDEDNISGALQLGTENAEAVIRVIGAKAGLLQRHTAKRPAPVRSIIRR